MTYNPALIVIDLQNDLVLKEGKAPIPAAEKIVPIVNKLISKFAEKNKFIIFSQNWYSRQRRGGVEPYCVNNSSGAALHRDLNLVLGKAVILQKVQSSAFSATDGFFPLEHFVQDRDVQELYLVGVSLDQAVLDTAKDGVDKGYKVFVVTDGTKAETPSKGKSALKELLGLGVELVSSKQVLLKLNQMSILRTRV